LPALDGVLPDEFAAAGLVAEEAFDRFEGDLCLEADHREDDDGHDGQEQPGAAVFSALEGEGGDGAGQQGEQRSAAAGGEQGDHRLP